MVDASTINAFKARLDSYGHTKQLNMILQLTWLVPETDQKKLQSDNVFIY